MSNQQSKEKSLEISRFQKFKAANVSRSELKNAPYNPRTINAPNKKKLRKSLDDHGLVETIVWNRRTGNIVGGHQRIEQLDALEKSKDYMLTVAEIDVDDAEEKKLNIILNNQNLMGDYDLEGLESLLKDMPDVRDVGFDLTDMNLMFDDSELMQSLNAKSDSRAAREGIEGLQKIKDFRKSQKEKMQDAVDNEFSLVLVFQNRKQVDEFLEKNSLPLTRYVDGREIAEKLGIKL